MSSKALEYKIKKKIKQLKEMKEMLNKMLEYGFYSQNNEMQHIEKLRKRIATAKMSRHYSKADIDRMMEELKTAEKLWNLRRKIGEQLRKEIKEYVEQLEKEAQ